MAEHPGISGVGDASNLANFANKPPSMTISHINDVKGRGLLATKLIKKGETIFEEDPIVCAQLSWNKDCSYNACDHCMKPLETPEENVQRLTKNYGFKLPMAHVFPQNFVRIPCANHCDSAYCSETCRLTAWNTYHRLICLGKHLDSTMASHPLVVLEDTWKTMHYPPETATIMILVRIVAFIRCSENVEVGLQRFRTMCKDVEDVNGYVHKLVGEYFQERVEVLRELFSHALYGPDLEELFTKEGFSRLMGLVGRNAQGIGTSPLSDWVRAIEQAKKESTNPTDELKAIDQTIETIYDDITNATGLEFMNSEGVGLYEIQSCINHSCAPNAEAQFPHSCARLAVVATRDIAPGEEICTSYLDECQLSRSRHSRQKVLRENYVFMCRCDRCHRQVNDPDETSEDEDGEEDDDELEDEEMDSVIHHS